MPSDQDWLIEHGFTSAPTQYRLYGRRFLQVWWPSQQCQSTEGGWLVIQRGLTLTRLTSPCYNNTTCMQILYKKIIWPGNESCLLLILQFLGSRSWIPRPQSHNLGVPWAWICVLCKRSCCQKSIRCNIGKSSNRVPKAWFIYRYHNACVNSLLNNYLKTYL